MYRVGPGMSQVLSDLGGLELDQDTGVGILVHGVTQGIGRCGGNYTIIDATSIPGSCLGNTNLGKFLDSEYSIEHSIRFLHILENDTNIYS